MPSIPADGPGVSRSRLVIPLDTHTIRVGRCLRLTRYTSPGWRMAADITATLRRVDPDDPVRYDFSLCHMSMMGACGWEQADRQRAVSAARVLPAGRRRLAPTRTLTVDLKVDGYDRRDCDLRGRRPTATATSCAALYSSRSSSDFGQSSRSRRESARSASSLPPVWQVGQ